MECVDSGREVECVLKDTITFVPDVRYGRVVKVYDGDTITIGAKLYPIRANSPIYRFSVRLNGIDTPELKGSSPEEHEIAVIARDWLSEMIMGKMVSLENVSFEKYGRLLATVYLLVPEEGLWGWRRKLGWKVVQKFKREHTSLNDQMIKFHFAVPYDGGHKDQRNWREHYLSGSDIRASSDNTEKTEKTKNENIVVKI